MKKRVGICLRVSTDGQTTKNQRRELEAVAERSDWEIVERVKAGLARAKASGVELGRGVRKDGKRSADEERWGCNKAELERRIRRLRKEGKGILTIARTIGVGTSTVQRALEEA